MGVFKVIISFFILLFTSNSVVYSQSISVSPLSANPAPVVSVQIVGIGVQFTQSSPTSCNSLLNVDTANVLLRLNAEEYYANSVNLVGGNTFVADFNLTGATIGLYDIIIGSDQGCPISCNACFNVCSSAVLGAPGAINGNTTVRRGDTLVSYSISPLAGASSYNWIVPSGSTITSGQGTTAIEVYYGNSSNSGNVRVRGINECGNGPLSNPLAVTVQYIYLGTTSSAVLGESNISVQIIGSGVNFSQSSPTSCSGMINVSGSNVVLDNGTDLINASYLNQAVDGSSVFSGIFDIPSGVNTGLYDVVVDYGGSCVFTCNNCFIVTCQPFAAGSISGMTNVDAGDNNIVYSTDAISNATSYLWTFPEGITIVSGGGNNSVTVNYSDAAQSGNIYVRGVNDCGNGSQSSPLAVTVRGLTTSPPSAAQGDNIAVSLAGSNVIFSQSSPTSCSGYLNLNVSNVLISNGTNNYTANAVSGLSVPNSNCTADFNIPTNAIPGAYDVIVASGSACPLICHSCLQINCGTPTYTYNPQTICDEDSYVFNGNTYTTANTYFDTLSNILGCDSVIITDLTVLLSSLSGYALLNSNGVSAGVVELYSVATDSIAKLYTSTNVNGDGSYYFTNVLSGEYLVRAVADTSLYPNAIPTYADSTHRWDSSKVWITSCAANIQNIYVISLLPPIVAGADVSGFIWDDDTLGQRQPGEPVRGAGVIIERKPNGSPSFRTTSNELGLYSFHGISLGDYDVYVEMPNATMLHTHSFSVTDTTLVLENLNFFIDSVKGTIDTTNVNNPDSIFTTRMIVINLESSIMVFPVPFSSDCKIQIKSETTEDLQISIEDVTGLKISSRKIRINNGNNLIILNDLQDKPSGVYFIKIVGKETSVIRVVKG